MKENVLPLDTGHFIIQPQNMENLWDEEWDVCLKSGEKKKIGSLSFENTNVHGEIHFSVSFDETYKGGHISEIFYAVASFVFKSEKVKEICTVCRHENENLVRGLEKAGYVLREFKDGNDYYSMKKQKTSWTGLYVMIGMIAGFIIGITLSNLWMGTISGVVIGTVIGFLMDKREQDNTESKKLRT
ncbi:GNAT family N-acetyltransferase [Butyrivibrio sp. INlla16]|uniref:GNAT family N-acetyltransferase n=1 Tax=Butyrivibrio sp. INlla16 TaxID=1520807 RepID=UPI0008862003|nr:GNAT family N-acetyltransferase [Butyrivibrio sp. INlla16]SDB61457.1 Acetyltransferase (GNAT) domain-containing protein [Butyrivibrio sp. INlla16]